MLLTSREYKVILDRNFFTNHKTAIRMIHEDLEELVRFLGLKLSGEFDKLAAKERNLLFLDTPDYTLNDQGLLLRQRVKIKNDKTEYTLKCRTEDRYIAAGKNVRSSRHLKSETKFEEDIAVPFISRFSHSNTVTLNSDHRFTGHNLPQTLAAGGELFPGLLAVQQNGVTCPRETALVPVNSFQVFEQVYKGPIFHFGPSSAKATVALILWRKGENGRILTCEISFRYENESETFAPEVAELARLLFSGMQNTDWAQPNALTKTQYIYGG